MAIIIRKKVAPAQEPAPLAPEATSPADALNAYPSKHVKTDRPNFDSMASELLKEHPGASIAWYLMASYLYYVHHESLFTDAYYDSLARFILDHYDELTHPHKHLITRDDMEAGTLYVLKSKDYPLMTKAAVRELVKGSWGLLIDIGG